MTRWTIRAYLGRLTDAPATVGVVGVLLLAVIWVAVFRLASVEREAALRAVSVSSVELTETYEAQVTRTLREISQALRLVRHMVESGARRPVLPALQSDNLLPSELIFTVAYTDSGGEVIESTRDLPAPGVAGRAFFEAQRDEDDPAVGEPWSDPASGQHLLPFSSRLSTPGGGFDGIVMVLVDAALFVSAYDHARLGEHGFIGLVDTDGEFLIRRRGDETTSGGGIDSLGLELEMPEAGTPASQHSVELDGTRIIFRVQPLYDFPITIAIGLSEDEWLVDADAASRLYIYIGIAASALVIAVLYLIGWLGLQVHRERARAFDEQAEHSARVEHLAFHDSLTGLPNRAYFTRHLAESISQSDRYNHKMAVMLLDLDRFKVVNDTLGHSAGDELLKEVAIRLKHTLRGSDFAARIGGDEFVILVPKMDSERGLVLLAKRVLQEINTPFKLGEREIRMTASIGVCVFPADGKDEESLLKHADIAMYHAKYEGKNNFQFYSSKIGDSTVDRLALETGLSHAIEDDEFVLHYQARVDLGSDRIVGAEALIRWTRPGAGLVSPLDFIPLAEETGHIIAIGEWVFREACRQCVTWQRCGHPGLRMSVNLSARQFTDGNLIEMIEGVLRETGMDPAYLDLEITESMLMRDTALATSMLVALRERGMRIAVDDFGTGYSSLSTLKKFPVDILKIDGSFVRDVIDDPQDRGLTEAIIAVGHALNLVVVGEGVETLAQAEYLRDKGCDEVQGYYVNRPSPAGEFTSLLNDPGPRTVATRTRGRRTRRSAG